jgi:hypothetical protein
LSAAERAWLDQQTPAAADASAARTDNDEPEKR